MGTEDTTRPTSSVARKQKNWTPVGIATACDAAEILRDVAPAASEALSTIGKLLPDNRLAAVWNVAVNGVMAGCRPEYMPILVALVEAMADPQYGVEHSGNTPGAETLIVLNGPLIKQLGFNYEQGALRDGFQPNTSIGRFWRLYLRNVAGFLPHQNDKGTFGNTWRVVLAENEDSLVRMNWPNVATDMTYLREHGLPMSESTAGCTCPWWRPPCGT